MSRAVLVSVLLALGLLAPPALAQPAARPSPRPFDVAPDTPPPAPPPTAPPRVAVRLEYTRGPGALDACPDERGLRGAVAAKLGYDPISSAASVMPLLRVAVVRQAGGFVASAERRDPAGRVEWTRPPLMDADCRHLIDVLGLAIAIALDPEAQSRLATSPPIPLPPEPPPPEPSEPPPIIASPAPSRRPVVRLGIRAGVAIGSLTRPTATLAADIGVGWPFVSISFEGRADMPVTGDVEQGTRLRTSVLAGSLVPCGHWKWFAGCGVVSVGVLRAAGQNLSVSREDSGVYAAAGLRAGVEWGLPFLPQLALRASGDVLVTIHPMTTLRENDGAKVWQTPPFAALLGGGLVARF